MKLCYKLNSTFSFHNSPFSHVRLQASSLVTVMSSYADITDIGRHLCCFKYDLQVSKILLT